MNSLTSPTKYFLLLMSATFTFGLTGCSPGTADIQYADSQAIRQTYKVTYNQRSNHTTLFAQFRFGSKHGTTIRLTGESKVTCNGVELKENEFLGTSYVDRLPGYKEEWVFHFNDGKGKTYINTVRLPEIHFAADMPKKFSRKKDLVVPFDGKPLARGEAATLEVMQPGIPVVRVSTREIGAEELTIPKARLRDFHPGTANIKWIRNLNDSLQESGHTNGEIIGTYETTPRGIAFVD